MPHKNLEDMTGSDVAEQTLSPLLQQVRESESQTLFCSLSDKVRNVKTGETGLFFNNEKIVSGLEELPSYADLFFTVSDSDKRLLGCYRVGGIERELDGRKFLGYSEHDKATIRQQVGIVLRYLLTLERKFYFENKIERKDSVEVDEDLIESFLVKGIMPRLEILHI